MLSNVLVVGHQERIAAQPGIHLAEILEPQGEITADMVYALLASDALYADLTASPLGEHQGLMATLGALCLPAMKWYTQAETECCRTGNRSLSTRVKASEEGGIWKILPALSYERS